MAFLTPVSSDQTLIAFKQYIALFSPQLMGNQLAGAVCRARVELLKVLLFYQSITVQWMPL